MAKTVTESASKYDRDKSLLDRYGEYSDKTTMGASAIQSVLATGQLGTELALASKLKTKETQKVTPGNISLHSYDAKTGAKGALDQSFASMAKMSRESGREMSPSAIDSYSKNAMAIEAQQAQINAETLNKASSINFESEERAKATNAQLASMDNKLEYENSLRKTGMASSAINNFAKGISNIADMQSRNVANKFNAEILLGSNKKTEEKDSLTASLNTLQSQREIDSKNKMLNTTMQDSDYTGDNEMTSFMNIPLGDNRTSQEKYDAAMKQVFTMPEEEMQYDRIPPSMQAYTKPDLPLNEKQPTVPETIAGNKIAKIPTVGETLENIESTAARRKAVKEDHPEFTEAQVDTWIKTVDVDEEEKRKAANLKKEDEMKRNAATDSYYNVNQRGYNHFGYKQSNNSLY